MRIVMITDDVAIDRRIILEANSLLHQGEEVLLLAREDPYGDFDKYPSAEVIRGLKILRIPAVPALHWVQKTAPMLQQKFVNVLNARSVKNQDNINAFGTRVMNKQYVAAESKRKLRLWVLKKWQYVCTKFFVARQLSLRLQAVGSYKLSLLTYKFGNFLNRNPFLGGHYLPYARLLNPDVVHIHDLPQLPAGVVLKNELKIPLIYDMHELYPLIATLTPKEQKFLRRVEKKAFKHVDEAIIVNPFAADVAAKMYKVKPPTVVQNATSATTGFSPHIPHDDRIRKKLGLGKEIKILLLQGWIDKSRGGIEELVEGMKMVDSDIHLVLLGYGALKEMKALGEEHGVGHRIHLIDAVPWDELLWWSAAADVGIIPYIPDGIHTYYASPNKLYEFIAAGLPIVANDLPFIRSVVAENNFGVLGKFSTPESFSIAINEIFANDGKNLATYKKNMLKNGYEFSWKSQEKILFDCYKRVGKPVGLSPAKGFKNIYPLD